MARVRNPQNREQGRVYTAELAFHRADPMTVTREEARWLIRRYCGEVQVRFTGRDPYSGYWLQDYDGERIRLPSTECIPRYVVLHEASHHRAGGPHGPAFTAAHIALTEQVAGRDTAARLIGEYVRAGVTLDARAFRAKARRASEFRQQRQRSRVGDTRMGWVVISFWSDWKMDASGQPLTYYSATSSWLSGELLEHARVWLTREGASRNTPTVVMRGGARVPRDELVREVVVRWNGRRWVAETL